MLKFHDVQTQRLFFLFRKAASAQQPVGFVSVSECCQPQRERPRQNGPRPAHPDVCHCRNSPAHCAGPPPLLSTCKSLTVSHHWSSLSHRGGGWFHDICFTLDEFTVHHLHLFSCVCPAGLSVELCRECGQPVRDKADPWLPALAFHPIGQAVLPELWLVSEVREHRRSVHFSERPRYVGNERVGTWSVSLLIFLLLCHLCSYLNSKTR